ncbi:MAG: TetR/AcrR family transcriptional regulator [Archangium sp.]
MAKTKAVDRRVARTRRTLLEAFVALMVERGWDNFGVRELCERADVARSTFYLHYADKEELVAGSIDDLRRGLRAQLAAQPQRKGPLGFSLALAQHAHEQRRLFIAVVGKKSGLFVQRKFRDMVFQLVREDLQAVLREGPARDAAIAFITGALLELLTWSLESRSSPGAEETDRLFLTMATPVLTAAR